MRYAINGYLFSQRQTGVMRLAREILCRIDKKGIADQMCLVVPEYATKVPDLENIKIIRIGSLKSNLWEQISFSRFVNRNGYISISFNNTKPFFSKGIMFIHDLSYKVHPEYSTSFHGWVSSLYHKLIFLHASKTTEPIFTISYFSKQQIIDYYHIKPERIDIIRCGWDHMKENEPDMQILSNLGLKSNGFYFTLGSISKMKNTKWVIDVAKRNPTDLFVVTGAQSNSDSTYYDTPDNVIMTGYLNDREIAALMKYCKAFLYPSLYEGFGIPPLEALSLGAEVVCSISAPLPEIYRNSVRYIDPYDTNTELDKVLSQKTFGREEILEYYSWDNACDDFCKALERHEKEYCES